MGNSPCDRGLHFARNMTPLACAGWLGGRRALPRGVARLAPTIVPVPGVPSGTSRNKRRKKSGLSWVSEPELPLIDPHPVKDDPQLAGEGDLGPLGTSPLGHVHGPGLELRPSCNPRHDDVRGFE